MIQRGRLNLVNHTVYDWIKTYQDNNKMKLWQFPEIIPAKSTVEIMLEWKNVGSHESEAGGKINYVLFGSVDRSFQIHANKNEGGLDIHFSNIMTPDYPIGSTLNIGLNPNGNASFTLSGTEGDFAIPKA